MTGPRITSIKGGADTLPPERKALIDGIRLLLEDAIKGDLVSITGVVERMESDDGAVFEPVCYPVLLGIVGNVDKVHRHCTHLVAFVDSLDGESWLGEDDDEEDD